MCVTDLDLDLAIAEAEDEQAPSPGRHPLDGRYAGVAWGLAERPGAERPGNQRAVRSR